MKKIIIFILLLIPFIGFAQINEEKSEKVLLSLINQYREKSYLPQMIYSDTAYKIAAFHAKYLAKNKIVSHNQLSRNTESVGDRAHKLYGFDVKYFIISENVYYVKSGQIKTKEQIAKYLLERYKRIEEYDNNLLLSIDHPIVAGIKIIYSKETKEFYNVCVFIHK